MCDSDHTSLSRLQKLVTCASLDGERKTGARCVGYVEGHATLKLENVVHDLCQAYCNDNVQLSLSSQPPLSADRTEIMSRSEAWYVHSFPARVSKSVAISGFWF